MSRTNSSAPVGSPTEASHSSLAALIDRLVTFESTAPALLDDVLIEMCRVSTVDAGGIIDPTVSTDETVSSDALILALWPKADSGAAPQWMTEAMLMLNTIAPSAEPSVRSLQNKEGLYGESSSSHVVFLPLRCADGAWHLGLFLLTTTDHALVETSRQQLAAMRSLYTLYDVQRATRRSLVGARNLSAATDVLSSVQGEERFLAAAMALCNEVHTKWRAQRVSIGLSRGRGIRLAAMSHTEHLNRKMPLVQALESAMEECSDQQVEVIYPSPTDQMVVSREAERLAQTHGPVWIVSLPLWATGEVVGVLTVERAPDQPMSATEAEALRLTCNLAVPPLMQLRDNDRWLAAKAVASVRRTAAGVVGPEHTWIKLGAIAGCLLLAFLIFFRAPDRVTGSFLIDARERRIVTAPFDGYLESVAVEPGDAVSATDVLATLETAELRLRAGQLEADRVGYLKEASIARRDGDIAEQQANEAEAARVQAELDLVRYQIDRGTVTSQTAGVVLEGDHRRHLGGAVGKGDVLFELAPLDRLEAQVYVPENRVGELQIGDTGDLASAAHPGRFITFVIERIEPAAIVHDNRNVFRVHARPTEAPDWLRPGMEGVAKVEVGRVSYLRLWTRDLVNWLRMKLWF